MEGYVKGMGEEEEVGTWIGMYDEIHFKNLLHKTRK